jgi:hypothetical protein
VISRGEVGGEIIGKDGLSKSRLILPSSQWWAWSFGDAGSHFSCTALGSVSCVLFLSDGIPQAPLRR